MPTRTARNITRVPFLHAGPWIAHKAGPSLARGARSLGMTSTLRFFRKENRRRPSAAPVVTCGAAPTDAQGPAFCASDRPALGASDRPAPRAKDLQKRSDEG